MTLFYRALACVLAPLIIGCQPTVAPSLDDTNISDGDGNAMPTLVDPADAIVIVDVPETGVALGWGWNRADQEPIPTICVEFVEGSEPAQTRMMTMHTANDNFEAMQAVGVSASAAVKTVAYKASAKAEFASEVSINTQSNTFVLNVEVHNGVRYAAPVPRDIRGETDSSLINERGGMQGAIRLTDKALRLAQQQDRTEFKRVCGTSFVSAIYAGAKLTALMTTHETSRAEKMSGRTTMSGSGWGARLEASVKAESTESSSREAMDLSIFQAGGAGDAIPATGDDLIAKLETISLEALAAPKD
ncbi:MAG: hypothetical protein AAGA84_11455, partial [Pseudomonadota bacterium]